MFMIPRAVLRQDAFGCLARHGPRRYSWNPPHQNGVSTPIETTIDKERSSTYLEVKFHVVDVLLMVLQLLLELGDLMSMLLDGFFKERNPMER